MLNSALNKVLVQSEFCFNAEMPICTAYLIKHQVKLWHTKIFFFSFENKAFL